MLVRAKKTGVLICYKHCRCLYIFFLNEMPYCFNQFTNVRTFICSLRFTTIHWHLKVCVNFKNCVDEKEKQHNKFVCTVEKKCLPNQYFSIISGLILNFLFLVAEFNRFFFYLLFCCFFFLLSNAVHLIPVPACFPKFMFFTIFVFGTTNFIYTQHTHSN